MKILAIETSCDETAAAVVEDGRLILSSIIASQVDIHARYGGVVPEVASRQHMLSIIPVIAGAMQEAEVDWADIAAIGVTRGPGLAGSLLVGVNAAKALALAKNLPLVGVNHLEGHIYANWLIDNGSDKSKAELLAEHPEPLFPLICLIVSGGHSDLILMRGHLDYQLLGSTRDDAAGEAFDKVGRLLDLGYPGGPAIQRVAAAGDNKAYKLPRAWLKDTLDFSFSGLKTAVLRIVEEAGRGQEAGRTVAARQDLDVAGLAAAFQEAVVDVLATKTIAAARKYKVRQIMLAGGVAANRALRERVIAESPLPVHVPRPILCTDNAAMIASAAFQRLRSGKTDSLDMDVVANLRLT
ncbi:MAG: tRNA (adenosine(37)-N6)-threonylcarbamoyltransferase complex transferase subunit TsaD [Dehalococcoidia bacterium]|nr:tRNA (adenosine(37)-N6)-threonylcarbamoyltransferase complex transferase subunit TsaD [Dehalococcoidia bacterium]